MTGISGSVIWSKILMELPFYPCGGFLIRSFKVCSDAEERVGCGKQREDTAPIQPSKTAA